MLKLKKNRTDLLLFFFKKENIFSKDLLKGFLIAAAFHGIFFILFRVHTILKEEKILPLPPVAVEVELKMSPKVFLEPPPLHLDLMKEKHPSYPPIPFDPTLPSKDELSFAESHFESIEKIPYVPLKEESS